MKSYGRWRILRYYTIGSTNDEARRLVEADEVDLPFVVWADRQRKGRGRGSNAWWSDEGSLTATLALDPVREGIRPEDAPLVALAGAYSASRLLEGWTGADFEIRWPNDVEFEGHKVAGLLCEWVETYDGRRLLLGVGINVATRLDDAPAEVRSMATSLIEVDAKARGRSPRLLKAAILLRFIEQFEGALDGLASRISLLGWVRHRDSLEGRPVRVRQGSRILTGVGRGIDDDGALRLETDEGIVSIYAGQVLRDLP